MTKVLAWYVSLLESAQNRFFQTKSLDDGSQEMRGTVTTCPSSPLPVCSCRAPGSGLQAVEVWPLLVHAVYLLSQLTLVLLLRGRGLPRIHVVAFETPATTKKQLASLRELHLQLEKSTQGNAMYLHLEAWPTQCNGMVRMSCETG